MLKIIFKTLVRTANKLFTPMKIRWLTLFKVYSENNVKNMNTKGRAADC